MVVFLVAAPLQRGGGGDARLAMAAPRLMCKKVKFCRKYVFTKSVWIFIKMQKMCQEIVFLHRKWGKPGCQGQNPNIKITMVLCYCFHYLYV